MVRAAAGADGVFLDRAQAGKRLADVDDARLRATHGLDDLGRGRGDAAHVADEVERDALGREQAARGTLERRDHVARRDMGTVPSDDRGGDRGVDEAEGHEREVEAGDDAGLAHGERDLGAHVARYDRVRGEVAGAAEILEQRCADDRLDEDGGKRGERHFKLRRGDGGGLRLRDRGETRSPRRSLHQRGAKSNLTGFVVVDLVIDLVDREPVDAQVHRGARAARRRRTCSRYSSRVIVSAVPASTSAPRRSISAPHSASAPASGSSTGRRRISVSMSGHRS